MRERVKERVIQYERGREGKIVKQRETEKGIGNVMRVKARMREYVNEEMEESDKDRDTIKEREKEGTRERDNKERNNKERDCEKR